MAGRQLPQDSFTFTGRVVVLASIIVGGWIFFLMLSPEGVPNQPMAFVMIPVVMGASAFFGVASGILYLIGVRVWKDSEADNRTDE